MSVVNLDSFKQKSLCKKMNDDINMFNQAIDACIEHALSVEHPDHKIDAVEAAFNRVDALHTYLLTEYKLKSSKTRMKDFLLSQGIVA